MDNTRRNGTRPANRRIKNITEDVSARSFDPDRDTILPKGGQRTLEGKSRPKQSGGANHRQNQTNTAPKGQRQGSQRKKKRKRRRTSVFYKILALIFIVVIIVAAFFVIRSYGAGSKSDRKGLKAYNDGDYVQAQSYFSEAIGYDKTNAAYYIHLGMAQIQNSQFDEAIDSFTEAETRTRSSDEIQSARRGRGIACLYKGSYGDAVAAFNDALKSAGGSYSDQEIDILYYLAEAQDKNNDPVGAVLSYTEIIKQKGDANAYMLRGLAYQRVGDNTNAESDLYKALEYNKKNYKVYISLYQVLTAQGKQNDAGKVLEEAALLTPKSGEDYSNRGLIYMYMQNYESAAADFEQALDKGYVPANFAKAQALVQQGNNEEAVESFNAYLAQVTDNALAYNEYGMCLMSLKRYEEAAVAFATGIALNDRTVSQQLMFNEIIVFERLAQWSTAYDKAAAYVERYPDDETGKKELAFLETRK